VLVLCVCIVIHGETHCSAHYAICTVHTQTEKEAILVNSYTLRGLPNSFRYFSHAKIMTDIDIVILESVQ